MSETNKAKAAATGAESIRQSADAAARAVDACRAAFADGAKALIDANLSYGRALAAARAPKDVLEANAALARSLVDAALAQASTASTLARTAAADVAQPLGALAAAARFPLRFA